MTTRSPGDVESEFELALLDAGRRDSRQPDIEQAWSRFAALVSSTASGIEPASGVHSVGQRHDGVPPSDGVLDHAAPITGASEIARVGKWVALGALGGCGLTLAAVTVGLGLSQTPQLDPKALATGTPAGELSPSQAAGASSDLPVDRADPVSAPSIDDDQAARRSKKASPEVSESAEPLGTIEAPSKPSTHPPSPRQPSGKKAYDLAAEVKHLDWVRRLSAGGRHEEVLRSVRAYHRRFPDGALAREAEVLAVESLARLQREAAASERAEEFLRRHPDDPQAKRVSDWAGKH
jgi:hypothetical protein